MSTTPLADRIRNYTAFSAAMSLREIADAVAALEHENVAVRAERDTDQARNEALRRNNERLERENEELREKLSLARTLIDADIDEKVAIRQQHDCGCEVCSTVSVVCPATASSYVEEIMRLRAELATLRSRCEEAEAKMALMDETVASLNYDIAKLKLAAARSAASEEKP